MWWAEQLLNSCARPWRPATCRVCSTYSSCWVSWPPSRATLTNAWPRTGYARSPAACHPPPPHGRACPAALWAPRASGVRGRGATVVPHGADPVPRGEPVVRAANAPANATVLVHHQASLAPGPLHVVDLNVSPGVQWPTLLESLTGLSGSGATRASVRLTVVTSATTTPHSVPFSLSPPALHEK
jgi:hypothetical protein